MVYLDYLAYKWSQRTTAPQPGTATVTVILTFSICRLFWFCKKDIWLGFFWFLGFVCLFAWLVGFVVLVVFCCFVFSFGVFFFFCFGFCVLLCFVFNQVCI